MQSPIKHFIFDKLISRIFDYRQVVLLAALTVAVTACKLSFIGQADCKKISNALQTALPPSAENLQEECLTNPQKPSTYRAEFTFSPEDLEDLQQHFSLVKVKYWYPTVPNIAESDADWVEKGSKMQSLLYAEYIGSDHLTKILIDTSDSAQYVVYYEEALLI